VVDLSLYPRYKELYQQAPLFARKKVVEVYQQTNNKSLTARLFKTHLCVVRQIIQRFEREGEEGLKNRSQKPKHSPNKTTLSIEGMILIEREKTGYGRDRIARNLSARGIPVKPSTVRYVLKRYQASAKYKRSRYRKKQRFYDFEELHPLEHFEVDLKEIYDPFTLSEQAIQHAKAIHIPLYQWTAIDIKTRLRFLSYSYEKTFSNGLVFLLTLLYFLRMLGMEHPITFQTDNGEEFGGKSVDKLEYLNREMLEPLQARLIHIPKGKKEWNAFVERSHQTDDNEFYIPQLELCQDAKEFFWRAMRWQWVYNTKRRHSTIQMTPMEKLLSYRKVPKYVAIFPVTNLDTFGGNIDIFFPKNIQPTGADVLTYDQNEILEIIFFKNRN
jgi:transposase